MQIDKPPPKTCHHQKSGDKGMHPTGMQQLFAREKYHQSLASLI